MMTAPALWLVPAGVTVPVGNVAQRQRGAHSWISRAYSADHPSHVAPDQATRSQARPGVRTAEPRAASPAFPSHPPGTGPASQPPDRSPLSLQDELTFNWPKGPTGSIPLPGGADEERGGRPGVEKSPGFPHPLLPPLSLLSLLRSPSTRLSTLAFHGLAFFPLHYFTFCLPGTLLNIFTFIIALNPHQGERRRHRKYLQIAKCSC